MRGPAGVAVGKLRRVLISNLVASDCDPGFSSVLAGIPGHAIEDIQIRDVYIQHRGGGTIQDAQLNPPEQEAKYPEPNMFGQTHAQGSFIRHARNIAMSHVECSTLKEDRRPAFVLDDVQDSDFFSIRAPQVTRVPTFALKNVTDFRVFGSKAVPDVRLDHVAETNL